jgi:hypothetical protein
MSKQNAVSPIVEISRLATLFFQWAIAVFGIAAPMMLVPYAFLSTNDAVARTHIVVHGAERLVAVLVITFLLGGLYLLGVKAGLKARDAGTDAQREAVAA